MKDLIGKTINNYRIEELIGEGAMGLVYRAYHPDLQQFAAIKWLRPELVNQEDSYERFLQEARTAAQLKHENIVKVINFGELANSYYIVMDYIEGINLRDLINANPEGIDLETVVKIFIQISDVLTFAHDQGVLHRDLKPDNILLSMEPDGDYRAMITDFGLVKIAHNSLTNTREGTLIGTPAYMSPEQCSGGQIDSRSDIYGLGVMLFEAVTGKRPYPIRTLFDAVKFHNSGQYVDARAHVGQLPKRFNILIRRMMNTEIEKRPPSAEEVKKELSRFYRQTDELSPITEAPPARSEPENPGLSSGTATFQPDEAFTSENLNGSIPYCIVVSYKGQVQKVYPPLNEKDNLVIGRHAGADIILSGPERYVSKEHCRIRVRNQQVTIEDLSSTNGTFLGNERLKPKQMYDWRESQDINLGVYKLTLKHVASKLGSDTLADLPQIEEDTMIQGRLLVKCKGAEPEELPLLAEPIIIGRLPSNHLVLSNARVSKKHCRIENKNGDPYITDLGSTNGTFMGNSRLTPNHPTMWDGSSNLRIGDFVIIISK